MADYNPSLVEFGHTCLYREVHAWSKLTDTIAVWYDWSKRSILDGWIGQCRCGEDHMIDVRVGRITVQLGYCAALLLSNLPQTQQVTIKALPCTQSANIT